MTALPTPADRYTVRNFWSDADEALNEIRRICWLLELASDGIELIESDIGRSVSYAAADMLRRLDELRAKHASVDRDSLRVVT